MALVPIRTLRSLLSCCPTYQPANPPTNTLLPCKWPPAPLTADPVECGSCGVWILWSVDPVECGSCGVWILWSVDPVECGSCEVWILWSVDPVECGSCGVWILWSVDPVECGSCGVWILWSVDPVECGMCSPCSTIIHCCTILPQYHCIFIAYLQPIEEEGMYQPE